MRYVTISTACVNRLLEEGYLLGECDKAYIDEVTMMILQENKDSECTDEDFILRVTSIGRLNLRRATEAEHRASPNCGPDPEVEVRPGIWKRLAWFIQSLTRGPSLI